MSMPKVLLDTDPGVDDALALIYAFKAGLDVIAVTTVAGNVPLINTTANAKFIVERLLHSSIPVYAGSAAPLEREPIYSTSHGRTGLGDIELDAGPESLNCQGVEKIVEAARRHGSQLSVITLGPLTNLARAVLSDPEAIRRIREIYVMGGAILTYGNHSRVSEFNFLADPHAAHTVLSANLNLVLVPVNVCRQVLFTDEHLASLAGMPDFDVVKKILGPFGRRYRERGLAGAPLYDPLTVGLFLNRDRMTAVPMDIQIETRGEHTLGMCVPELRPGRPAVPNVHVVERIDPEYYLTHFLDTLQKPA